MLRGIDPTTRLRTTSPVEAAVIDRALQKAVELRQHELDYLAYQIAKQMSGKG